MSSAVEAAFLSLVSVFVVVNIYLEWSTYRRRKDHWDSLEAQDRLRTEAYINESRERTKVWVQKVGTPSPTDYVQQGIRKRRGDA